jgi:hypothetical protein
MVKPKVMTRDFDSSSSRVTRSIQIPTSEINPDQNQRSEYCPPNLAKIEEKYGISNYVKEYEKMKYYQKQMPSQAPVKKKGKKVLVETPTFLLV